jgi:hypothetical protein
MSIHIKIRNFTGTCLPLDIDPKKTVSDVKDLIAARGKGKSARVPTLAFKGHELRDTRQLEHYDISANDTIHILPPSKVAKMTLHCEKEDGGRFNLSVNSDFKVDQLKREICNEEKITAKQLKVISTQEDPDGNEVITLKELNDDDVLSTLSLEDEVLAVYTSIQEMSGPSEFGVLLSIDDRLQEEKRNIFGVAVKSDQTLGQFREEVLDKHAIRLSDYTLILIGRELKDDQRTLGDLGFTSGCTIHAVQFCVTTPGGEDFDMAVSPTTRISAVRKMLEEVDMETNYDEYWFSLDGLDNLKESRTFWDLDIKSGSMILLNKRCLINVIIRCVQFEDHIPRNHMFEISVENDDTVEVLHWKIKEIIGFEYKLALTYKQKPLQHHTLKEEGFHGGEVLDLVATQLNSALTSSRNVETDVHGLETL